jgi:hypothetical protein
MKNLMSLWRSLAVESARRCCTSADLDVKLVEGRVESQGESFFTITLPQFAKDFERSLEMGCIVPGLFLSFKKRGGLPVFLSGYLAQIFGSDGSLLSEPSIECIRVVRLLSRGFGKMRRQCSDARIDAAMRRYVEIEAELQGMDNSSFEEFLPLFRKASTLLFADVFSTVQSSLLDMHRLHRDYALDLAPTGVRSSALLDERAADPFFGLLPESLRLGKPAVSGEFGDCEIVDPARWQLVPRHGPGATSDGLRGNAKYTIGEWPQRLESYFPYGEYALPQLGRDDQLDRVKFLEPGMERPAKVIDVPKTLKNPRIIAIEPTAVQYCQQAISRQFVQCFENGVPGDPSGSTKYACNLGIGMIGFKDQEPNRLLARSGSINGHLATLDLSEASDRVLNLHVVELLARFPHLSGAVQATRTAKADVPGYGVIPLVKFASMGSALCFPMEAMVFLTIIVSAISYERSALPTRRLINSLRGSVRVYGDDIIVPVEYVPVVIRFLQLFGLVVNADKSFWNGMFRESCGGDYYAGEWVTPVYLREDLPQSRRDVREVVSLVSYRNQLYWAGYWETARLLDERISFLFRGAYPIVESTSAVLGRESACFDYEAEWACPDLHEPLVQGYVQRSVTPESPISGEGALLKFLIKEGLLPSQDPEHLERQGRPHVSSIKRGWKRPY